MKRTNRLFLIGSLAVACAACSAAPDAANGAQPAANQSTPAAAPMPASPTADATTSTHTTAEQTTAEAALMSQASVSREQATRTALAQVPNGVIQDAELEEEHQLLVWSFDIATPGSKDITEVEVDARTGMIASTQVETPSEQAQEIVADKAAH